MWSRVVLCVAIAASAFWGCAKTRPAAVGGPGCFLSPPPSGPDKGAIVVQLGQAVEAAHAPVATNDSETIVFRQLYETLTEIDCDGTLRGRLAERWDSDAEGRTWTITLEPRRYWDGSALRAEDVLVSWRTAALRATSTRAPWCWIDPSNVTAIDSRHLEIRLRDPMPALPRVLSHSALGVASVRPGQTWPVGTGAFHVAQTRSGLVQCQSNPYASPSITDRSPQIAFQPRPGSDPRDLDVGEPVVRRVWSRKAISFLATRGLQVQRLPWSLRYVVLFPDPLSIPLDRADLAALVAESEAEPCDDLGWSDLPCGALSLPRADSVTVRVAPDLVEPVVMVLASDRDGTRIAERIASRASPPAGDAVAVRAVEPLPFYGALSAGRALAFVLAVPLELEATCLAPSDLVAIAPWLLDGWEHAQRLAHPSGGDELEPTELEQFLLESGHVLPVLRTGASLVSREGLAGVRIDGSGTPRFRRAGWEKGTALP
jgi:hypothetical protein